MNPLWSQGSLNSTRWDFRISPLIPVGSNISPVYNTGWNMELGLKGQLFSMGNVSPAFQIGAGRISGAVGKSLSFYSLGMYWSPKFPFSDNPKLKLYFPIGLGLQRVSSNNSYILPDLHLGISALYELKQGLDLTAFLKIHESITSVEELGGSLELLEVAGIGLSFSFGKRSFNYKKYQTAFAKNIDYAKGWEDDKSDDALQKHYDRWLKFLTEFSEVGLDTITYSKDERAIYSNAEKSYELINSVVKIRKALNRLKDLEPIITDSTDNLHSILQELVTIENDSSRTISERTEELSKFESNIKNIISSNSLKISSQFYGNVYTDLYLDEIELVVPYRENFDNLFDHIRFQKYVLGALSTGDYSDFIDFFSVHINMDSNFELEHEKLLDQFKILTTDIMFETLRKAERGERKGLIEDHTNQIIDFFKSKAGQKYFPENDPLLVDFFDNRGWSMSLLTETITDISEPDNGELDDVLIEDPVDVITEEKTLSLSEERFITKLDILYDAGISTNSIESWTNYLLFYKENIDILLDLPERYDPEREVREAGNSINRLLFKSRTAENCKMCHKKIYDDWKESYHGKAWTDERFKNTTKNYEKKECLACHAPEPMFETGLTKDPELRFDYQEEGINCYSCHAQDRVIVGPYKESTLFHSTRREKKFRTVEMCQSCHPSTFKEWKERKFPLSNKRYTCQSCHMSAVFSKNPQRASKYGPIRNGILRHDIKGAHSISHIRDAFENFGVRIEGDNLKIILVNNSAAHRIPTGISGRKFEIRAQMLDGDGNALKVGKNVQIREIFERNIPGKEGPKMMADTKREDSSMAQGFDSKFEKLIPLPEGTMLIQYKILFFMDREDKEGRVVLEGELKR